MSYHKLKRGFDINLAGKAVETIAADDLARQFALKPTDFVGMYRPKLTVKAGDYVRAGDPVFFDKALPEVFYTAPVSGTVSQVVRGAKRKLLEVIIDRDAEVEYKQYDKYSVSDISKLAPSQILETLTQSGIWPTIIQRPFGIVANPQDKPKSIFLSLFDSHPLAANYDFIYKEESKYFDWGVQILHRLVGAKIYLGAKAGTVSVLQKAVQNNENVEVHSFQGKHPAGNVGVQIAHIEPINKGDIVWTISPFGVIQIGKLFLNGIYDARKIVALAGSEVESPQYFKTYSGTSLANILENRVKNDNVRIISGNVLTGKPITSDGFLSYYDNLISVLPEGNRPRFVLSDGWLAFTKTRLSFYKAWGLLSSLIKSKKPFELDTSLNGEPRAFVFTGNLEKVLPMPIYPTHLIKAIMAEDFEDMENLGIYELIEEDLALCEFIDVSKHPIQNILREGLDLLRNS